MEARTATRTATSGNGVPAAGERHRVLIAGGGVAALEAVLALREAVGDRAGVTLLSPDRELRYRPLAPVEPFGLGAVEAVPLSRAASDLGLDVVQDLLASIDGEHRVAITASGGEIAYDALLVAIGARAEPAVPGAITYRGPESAGRLEQLLAAAEAGDVAKLAFAVPPIARWSLPLYELAVLSARHLRRRGAETEIVLVTHEQRPLELFGEEPSEGVRQLLAIEGVELLASAAPAAVRDGELRLAGGGRVGADAVVALPRFVAAAIPGLPQGPNGFVATDPTMAIEGMSDAWAVGDVTWFPIKQGGLAAQQADVAALAIASRIDPAIEPRAFAPVLRGVLMTGWTPYYLRRTIGSSAGSQGSEAPLWWPPSKVAGRLLAPYLAGLEGAQGEGGGRGALEDLDRGSGEGDGGREEDHLDALGLALTSADLDARERDYAGALRWLDAAERLNLTLPYDYARKRERWRLQREALEASPR